jgi:hypothetical protein
VRFKPDGSAFEQYCSRGGNTWGLDITWDGQVFSRSRPAAMLFHHVVLPEYVLAKGKLPGVTSSNGILLANRPIPLMQWEKQAYVQIDQVGSYTAAAGCAIYEGGAWPAKWNYGYFTTEPTLNIVSHFQVEPDGVTYKARASPAASRPSSSAARTSGSAPSKSASAPTARCMSSISTTRPSSTTTPAAPPTARECRRPPRPRPLLRPHLEGSAQGGEEGRGGEDGEAQHRGNDSGH